MGEKEVNVNKIVDNFKLQQLNNFTVENRVEVSDIKRPGLELAGFFDYFTPERIHVLGMTEISFLKGLPKELLVERLKKFFAYDMPCVIITRGLQPPQEVIDFARDNRVLLFSTNYATTSFISMLTSYLEEELAPEITRHGVLVEVYGVGLLIIGDSGIGKSESALDLVKKGHRLVSDDAVIIKRVMRDTLIGYSPEISKHHMELRGLGIIDVKTLFGVGAVREEQSIDFIINLEDWDEDKNYDRLGLKEETGEILGVNIPKVTVPVKPGRNLAMVMEVAAMNYRLKSTGYNTAEEFTKRLKEVLKKDK